MTWSKNENNKSALVLHPPISNIAEGITIPDGMAYDDQISMTSSTCSSEEHDDDRPGAFRVGHGDTSDDDEGTIMIGSDITTTTTTCSSTTANNNQKPNFQSWLLPNEEQEEHSTLTLDAEVVMERDFEKEVKQKIEERTVDAICVTIIMTETTVDEKMEKNNTIQKQHHDGSNTLMIVVSIVLMVLVIGALQLVFYFGQ